MASKDRVSYVYILTNESLPGIVKIGMTTKKPSERAAELHTTGVPTPFIVFAAWKIPADRLKEYETKSHKLLEKYRVRSNREFFKIDAVVAKEKLAAIIPTPENIEAERKRETIKELNRLKSNSGPIQAEIDKLSESRRLHAQSIDSHRESLKIPESKKLKYLHLLYGFCTTIGEWIAIILGAAVIIYFVYINKRHNLLVYSGGAFIAYWAGSSVNKFITPYVDRLEAHRWTLPDPHSILRYRIAMAEEDITLIDRQLRLKNSELTRMQERTAARAKQL
jgi:hypothetical protein